MEEDSSLLVKLIEDVRGLIESKIHTRSIKPEYHSIESRDSFIKIDDNAYETISGTPKFSLTQHKFAPSFEEDDIIAEIYGKPPLSLNPEEEVEDKSLTSISVFNDSPKNAVIDHTNEIPMMESPRETENIRKNDDAILRYFQSFTSTLETFEGKLDSLSSRMSDIEKKVENELNENSIKNQDIVEVVKSLSNEIKIIKNASESSLSNDTIKQFLEKVLSLENKDKNRSKLFEELGNENSSLRETSKDLELKIDKIELDIKNQLKSVKNTSMSRNEISDIREAQVSLNLNMENIAGDIYHLNEEIIKIKNQTENQSKSSLKLSKIRADQERWNNEIVHKLERLEEKEKEVKKVRENTETIQNELHDKLAKLEERLHRENANDPSKEATIYSISTLEKRMHALDEKVAKELLSMRDFSMSRTREFHIAQPEERKISVENQDFKNESLLSTNLTKNFESKEKNDSTPPLTISQLEKEQLYRPSIPKFFAKSKHVKPESKPVKVADYRPDLTPQALRIRNVEDEIMLTEENELEPTRDLPIPIKKKKSDRESLNERIARLEKFNKKSSFITSEKAVQSSEKNSELSESADLGDFLPGETESLIMSTMLEKANKSRIPENLRQSYRPFRGLSPLSSSFKSISQYSQKQSPSNSEYLDSLPSQELQEHLKLRGFRILENRPILNHKNEF